MKSYFKIFIIFVIGLIIITACYFYNKHYHENIRKKPTKYIYETFLGPSNPVLIIEDLKFKDSLINYYTILETNPKTEPSFNFPLKTVPTNDPVYIMGYSEDGKIAEFVSYYDRGTIYGGSHLRGWTYSKTLHDTPPNDIEISK